MMTSLASSGLPGWWLIGRRRLYSSGCRTSRFSNGDGRLSLPRPQRPIHEQVDYRLLGSAVARVRWELSIEQSWKRNPEFYVDQTLGSVYLLLLPPPPFSEARQAEIVARVKQIPITLQAAQENLTDLRQPFVQLAIDSLDRVAERSEQTGEGTRTATHESQQPGAATSHSRSGNSTYGNTARGLRAKLPTARKDTAIGRDNYIFFLRKVALLPYTPEQLLAMSHQEWSRSVAFEAYQQTRLAGAFPAPFFPARRHRYRPKRSDEEKVRAFLVEPENS